VQKEGQLAIQAIKKDSKSNWPCHERLASDLATSKLLSHQYFKSV